MRRPTNLVPSGSSSLTKLKRELMRISFLGFMGVTALNAAGKDVLPSIGGADTFPGDLGIIK